MNHIVVVKVVDGLEDLSDCLGRILFRELAIFANPIKEFSTGGQLCYNIVFVLRSPHQRWTMLHSIRHTLDSNQSWNRTIWGCFILCSRTISS